MNDDSFWKIHDHFYQGSSEKMVMPEDFWMAGDFALKGLDASVNGIA